MASKVGVAHVNAYANFETQSFSRKFRNFVMYRLACFAKNGEKLDFKIWTFFDC
ncbi:hypothetical protein T10_11872 [Trichinella papuae]|uniref:Uncharacterized protein n=1 Tax=Trichinella papuae TaxID=268474 RepID=A0A0V1LZI8_9BILA|nr:hypothetical protein T10_11872 [Trichinella papuae]